MKAPENQKESIDLFKQGIGIFENALAGLSENELDFISSKGGWSIRQIVHHVTDGDDIWKSYIKIALGNEQAEFTLKWYLAFPQTEWAEKWNYKNRPVDVSLNLFKANRNHILQLLEHVPDCWNKSALFRDSGGEIEELPVGFVIKMQTDHVVHHTKRILEIRKEIAGA